MALKAESLMATAPEGKPLGESRTDNEGKAYWHKFTQEELNEKYGVPEEVKEIEEKVEEPKEVIEEVKENKPKKKGKKK